LLLLLGTASVLAGAAGLVFELTGKRDSEGFLLVLVLAAFGLSCLFLCYVTHGRRRLRVIADLRAKLEAGTPDAFDTIAGYNREQINTAREHAIKAEARRGDAGGYTYLQNPAVRDAKQALDTAELMAVLSHGARVIEDPPETQGQTRYDPIEGTHLELGYTVDRAARQVTFTWLAREGTARPASPREESPSDADSTYRISLTPSAKVSAASLSAEQRAAADAMIIDVASDPARYSHLTRPTKEGQLVLPLPFPSLELTYSVDQAARVVNVVHMSSPIPAQRIMFVSYSHEDTVVYEKIMEFVGELEKEGLLQIWSDKLIRPGDRWDDEIKKALERAQSALLLVSQKFVCSAYITRNELPYLLGRALEETNPLKIFWVPVTDSTVDSSYPAITTFQSLLTPLTPTLEDLTREGKLNEALKKIFSNLRELLLGQDKVERLA